MTMSVNNRSIAVGLIHANNN